MGSHLEDAVSVIHAFGGTRRFSFVLFRSTCFVSSFPDATWALSSGSVSLGIKGLVFRTLTTSFPLVLKYSKYHRFHSSRLARIARLVLVLIL